MSAVVKLFLSVFYESAAVKPTSVILSHGNYQHHSVGLDASIKYEDNCVLHVCLFSFFLERSSKTKNKNRTETPPFQRPRARKTSWSAAQRPRRAKSLSTCTSSERTGCVRSAHAS